MTIPQRDLWYWTKKAVIFPPEDPVVHVMSLEGPNVPSFWNKWQIAPKQRNTQTCKANATQETPAAYRRL